MKKKYNDLINRIKRLDSNLNRAIVAKQILIAGSSKEICTVLNGTPEAAVSMFLIDAAQNELVLSLRRILEPASKDKCSFSQLIKIRNTEKMDNFIMENIKYDKSLSFESVKDRYSKLINKHYDKIMYLKEYRDMHIGHTLIKPKEGAFKLESGVSFSELYQVLDEICLLFEEFTRLTKYGCSDNTSKNKAWNKDCNIFWTSLTKGVCSNE